MNLEEAIPMLRAEIHDVRVEARGWAEVAVRASNKANAASEIINLIYADVREIKEVQQDHGKRLDTIDNHLEGIETRLDGMDARFDGVETRLDGMDARFDGVDTRLDGMDSKLTDHGEMLQKILAKLS